MDQRTASQTADAIALLEGFKPGRDGLAHKSRELALGLLRHTEAPFSRKQYAPGHITCTALVKHPSRPLVLFMHHHRLRRWLLPGGHVEPEDVTLAGAAAREACEETAVQIDTMSGVLAGIDVHAIALKKREPFHLHHDLIWCFRAVTDAIETTPEAPEVTWAGRDEWDRLSIAESIRRSIVRAG